jgi:hypothetical protein
LIIFLVGLFTYFSIGQLSVTLGASGAVFAVLVAFAFYYPDAQILLFFVIPVRAKYMVLLYVAYDLYSYMFRVGGNISYVGHLGGVIFALFYFLIWGRSARRGRVSRIVGEVQKKHQQIKDKADTEQDLQMKRDIIIKIRAGAAVDDLTDDDFQFIKYCHILYEADEPVEGDILEQEMISNKQFITEVRKFISLK